MIKYLKSTLYLLLMTGLVLFSSETAYSHITQDERKPESITDNTTQAGNTYVSGITRGRAISITTGLLGVISLILSWRSKRRASRKGAKVALATSLIVISLSVVHLGTTAGAVFGSGSGKAGAIVSLIVGVASSVLSATTLRTRKGSVS